MAGGERSKAEVRRHRGKKIDFNGLNEVSYGPLTTDKTLPARRRYTSLAHFRRQTIHHYCSSAAISNTRNTSRAR